MPRYMLPAINAAAVAALLAGAPMGRGEPNVIENRGQALPKGAARAIRGGRDDRKARERAAAAELVRISNQTLVVHHLHPRWLRAEVEHLMDIGVNVTMEMVNGLRNAGPLADA